MARVWSMRFNLDTFNASYAALDDDLEKAQWLTGFSRGLNGGALKDDQPTPMNAAYAIGTSMRVEAEAKSAEGAIHAAKRGKGQATLREPSRPPEGGLLVPGGDGVGDPEAPGLRIKDQGLPDQEKLVPRAEPVPGEVPKTKGKPKPKLEAILGPKGSPDELAYWKLVSIFGGQTKNPAPTETAQAFVDAILKYPCQTILDKAQNLRDAQSDLRYMPMLQKWLDGQGYLNPNTLTGKGPSHRSGVDDEYLAALEEGGMSA